jgi:hypothetical protein
MQLEIFRAHSRPTSHDDAAFHPVLQFAHIPGP